MKIRVADGDRTKSSILNVQHSRNHSPAPGHHSGCRMRSTTVLTAIFVELTNREICSRHIIFRFLCGCFFHIPSSILGWGGGVRFCSTTPSSNGPYIFSNGSSAGGAADRAFTVSKFEEGCNLLIAIFLFGATDLQNTRELQRKAAWTAVTGHVKHCTSSRKARIR